MKYLFSLLSFVLILSCATSQTTSNYSKIEYEAGACFGFCPIYKMTINEDRTATFEAIRFNFSRDVQSEENEGTFKGKIDPEKYKELLSMLNSLHPQDLKDYYVNKNISDLPTSYLTLSSEEGTVKKIQDYGKSGTPELIKLYHFFDDLKKSQNWTKIE